MSLFDFVKRVSGKREVELSTPDVQRIVGTLRAAGFVRTVPERLEGTASEIVNKELLNLRTRRSKIHTASKNPKEGSTQEFLASKGTCPRCKVSMSSVKLSSYESAFFCSACRATLWQDG